jgi:hypothetical protein
MKDLGTNKITSYFKNFEYFEPNSVRIRFLSCKIFVLPLTGFELTPLTARPIA